MAGDPDPRLERQLDYLMAIEPLKRVERRSPVLETDRRENSAEHSWHVALAAWLLAEHADEPVDAAKVMLMMLLHDLGEVDAGDVFVYDADARARHHEQERAGIQRLASFLPDDQAAAMQALWDEFEDGDTPEARFARALDRLQPMLLNYASEGAAWKEHGIREEQVVAVNSVIAEGSATLWARARRLISDAVAKGFIRD